MVSLGLRCGVNPSSTFIRNPHAHFRTDRSTQIPPFNNSLSISNHVARNPPQRISASTNPSNLPISSHCYDDLERRDRIFNQAGDDDDDKVHNEPMFSEKLDEWMRDSVAEIVKNIKQSPLLVQVYANNNGSTEVKTEKAVAENWDDVKRKWIAGEKPSPDGIILVEELDESESESESESEEDETRSWGVVVQGKGVETKRGPACYLLKTSRVGSGLGLFCTHFCLVRVKSFRESALSQLTNCWLL